MPHLTTWGQTPERREADSVGIVVKRPPMIPSSEAARSYRALGVFRYSRATLPIVSDEATRILDAALKLPDAERAEIAAILADSVRHGTDLSPSEFDAAWSALAQRRSVAIDRGELGTVDYDELMNERRRIAELLLDSVSTDTAEEIETAWVAEAVRRANELERGQAEALDGESVLRDLKAKFQSAGR